ncbi:hypothetical protein [Jiangella muralis]|uniref:hypothetical protein n=1 Tax=Jiangella muralis TaxID=702383 RepID=UPI00069DC909|nr:hypothetical protein [Jiangella muralis]
MAMTPGPGSERGTDGELADPDIAVVDRAAAALRSYTDHAWAGASQRILQHVLAATRRSRPVRGVASSGPFHVSDQVITTHLQEAVDSVPGVDLTHVRLDLDGDVLVAVVAGVAVDYPERIHPAAATVRRLILAQVAAILGPVVPMIDAAAVTIEVRDVNPPPSG